MEQKSKRRYYKKGEMVWIINEKREGKVKSVNKETYDVVVTIKNGREIKELTKKLWEIDKLKSFPEKKLITKNQKHYTEEKIVDLLALIHKLFYPEVYFAPVREGAIIPSKRKEDAGYDVYANLDEEKYLMPDGHKEIYCPANETTLVPTGLACAMPTTHYLNLKHERGSTAVKAMAVFAGVIDSGFRNEMFVALCPLHKDLIITDVVEKVEENDTHVLYPLSKAICQGTIDIVPEAIIKTITYDELKAIASERGMTMLGESGK